MSADPETRERRFHGLTATQWAALSADQIRRLKCIDCGHVLGSHNELSYCRSCMNSKAGGSCG